MVDVLFAVIALSADELLAELEQALLGLLELSLLPLIQFDVVLERNVRFNLARSRLRRDIVEIDVGLQKALLHELDRLVLGSNLLLQFKIVVLLLEVGAAARHVLLVLVKSIAE